jgi:hypothetical protein
VTVLPEDEPAKEPADGLWPIIDMVKSDGFLFSPIILFVIIIFLNSPGRGDEDDLYWLVIVHCSVPLVPLTPEQPAKVVETYPTGPHFSVTL